MNKVIITIAIALSLTNMTFAQFFEIKNDTVLVIVINPDTGRVPPQYSAAQISKLTVIEPDDKNWFVASYKLNFKMNYESNTLWPHGPKLPSGVLNLGLNNKVTKFYFDELTIKQSNGKTIMLNLQLVPTYPK